jgi:hypothetical protein
MGLGSSFFEGRTPGWEKRQKFSPVTGRFGNDLDKFLLYYYFFIRGNGNF